MDMQIDKTGRDDAARKMFDGDAGEPCDQIAIGPDSLHHVYASGPRADHQQTIFLKDGSVLCGFGRVETENGGAVSFHGAQITASCGPKAPQAHMRPISRVFWLCQLSN